MSKTTIEWTDYTINPIKGLCPMDCKDNQGKSYCYARRMYQNPYYKVLYNHREIQWQPYAFSELYTIKKPSKIFVGSTMELFGPWVKPEWMDVIFQTVKAFPQHTFIFLTKQPQNLPKEWPDNCWVGLSVDGTPNAPLHRIYNHFDKVKATVKFLSFEPLLAQTKLAPRDLEWTGISWVICGQCTPVKASTQPKIEWISKIVKAADKASIRVFLKDNLLELVNYESPETAFAFNKQGEYRQEFPER